LTQGAVTADWWAQLAADTAFKVANAVRQGLVQGETNQQIIARITGKVGVPGVMDISRRNAAAVVQTSALTVANAARLKTLEANADIAPRLKWFSALDGHVCPRCIALSGKIWTNSKDGTHEPVGHSVPFQNPPIHWNDRCLLLPITKSFAELGIDLPEPEPSTRASSEGQISANTTFEQWLSRRTQAQQDEQLGPGKADLWRRKVITLSQLIDGRGRELTLAQLRAKYL
jgi:hypothetical protein